MMHPLRRCAAPPSLACGGMEPAAAVWPFGRFKTSQGQFCVAPGLRQRVLERSVDAG